MSKEILLPKNFCEGLKEGKLKLGKISDDTSITIERPSELHDELVENFNEEFAEEIKKDVNEEFAEKIKKEHDFIDGIIDYLWECKKIYKENDNFNKNMSLGDFFQLVRIVNKCD